MVNYIRTKISQQKFRKDFNINFPHFQLRIRKKGGNYENQDELDLCDDIAYFNGIKAFTIKGGKDYLNISLPDTCNIFKTNITQYRIATNNSIKDYSLKEYKKEMKDLYNNDFFDFYIKKIEFEINVIKDSDEINKLIKEKYNIAIKKFLNDIKIDCFVNYKDNNKVEIVRKDDMPLASSRVNVDNLVNIQMLFYEDLHDVFVTYNDTNYQIIKDIDLNVNSVAKSDTIVNDFTEFRKLIVKANLYYRGKAELEKRYQHMLILYGNKLKNIFNPNSEQIKIFPFEQEYPINPRDDKDGRVDCVYYSTDSDERILLGIYLVEVKIDDSVVDGAQGVLTHLNDIYNIKDEIVFKNILNIINYRRTSEGKNTLIVDNKISKNFYTLFGYSKENSKNIIKNKLHCLNDIDILKGYMNRTRKKAEQLNNAYYIYKKSLEYKFDFDLKRENVLINGNVLPIKDYVFKIKEKSKDWNIKFFFDNDIFDLNNDKTVSYKKEGKFFHKWDEFMFGDNKDAIYNISDFSEWDPNFLSIDDFFK